MKRRGPIDPRQPTDTRELTILTWGKALRDRAPPQSERNFDVCQISKGKPHGVDLKKNNGLCVDIQHHVEKQTRYPEYKKIVVDFVLTNPQVKTISINCTKGRHRSVAFAQLIGVALAHEHGIIVNIRHLDIK